MTLTLNDMNRATERYCSGKVLLLGMDPVSTSLT